MVFHGKLQAFLKKELKTGTKLETPPDSTMGDAALPCFEMAKKLKKAPDKIAEEFAAKLKKPKFVEKIEAKGPYLNFFFKKDALAEKTLLDIAYEKEKYGTGKDGRGKLVVMDYSSPNIGKPFHFGHLRSTVIGNSLYCLLKSQGFKVLRINHLGDWGTQFGALIYAFQQWGDKKKLAKEPIKHLLELYVKFHDKTKQKPELQEEARKWFKKLEDNNKKAAGLWAKFRKESLDKFKKIYNLLGIAFDSFNGEAHSTDFVEEAITLCEKNKLTEISEGALVVPLDGFEIPLILRKSDEATTYASRDLATILYRTKTYSPSKIVYVVGREQCLHFQQLFALSKKIGFKPDMVHVDFGFYLSPEGGKMATRKGKAVFMEDVLNEAIALALKTIKEKNPKLKNKEKIARDIAIGAIIFGDLMNDRNKDVVFDLKKILDFEGDTGPYLQYTHARANSIVHRAKKEKLNLSTKADFGKLSKDIEKQLIIQLGKFKDAIEQSIKNYKPHILAQYLLVLGRKFNEFYHSCSIIKEKDKDKAKARLLLVECSRIILKNGLGLLGITAPEEM